MTARPYILSETTWKTVRDTPYEVAVLPWGATEAHNYHLPYGTDCIETSGIATEAARLAWERGARVIVLPTVPFGVQTGQLDLRFCLNMKPSSQQALLQDLAHSLAGQGVPKLVVLNGHGGNDFRQMIREVGIGLGLFICTLSWYTVVDPRAHFSDPGEHGGELETSLVLHLAPELVRPLAEAGSGAARPWKITALREGWVWAQRRWTKLTRDTGVGDPKGASTELGARYAAAVTQKIAGFLVELAAADPDDLYDGGE